MSWVFDNLLSYYPCGVFGAAGFGAEPVEGFDTDPAGFGFEPLKFKPESEPL